MVPPTTEEHSWHEWRGRVDARLEGVEDDLKTVKRFGFWLLCLLFGLLVLQTAQLAHDVDVRDPGRRTSGSAVGIGGR